MEDLTLEKFNPTVAEIQSIVEKSKGITISDFTNESQLMTVRSQRIILRDTRVDISKQGKKYRQRAIDFQRMVILKEKELIELMEPEEKRLAGLEEQARKIKERAERLELLPKRKERLVGIGDVLNDALIGMDSATFEDYFNTLVANKNEKDRIALEKKQEAVKAEEEKLAREKEMREREEKIRQEEREKAERAEQALKEERVRQEKEAKERIVREEREAKERIAEQERAAKERLEREEREKKEVEEKAKAEAKEAKKKLDKDKKYQEFLAKHGWTKKKAGKFYVEVKGRTHTLYKKVGEITL